MRFFDSGASGLSRLLEEPPSFRHAGFDLRMSGRAELRESSYLEVTAGEWKAIRLYQDGSLLARVAADSSFLGWGSSEDAFIHQPRLNPVAVVEIHAAFVTLLAEVLTHFSAMPAEVDFRLELHDPFIDGNRLFLTKWYERGIQHVHNPERYRVQAADPSAQHTVLIKRLRQHPLVVAYDLVARFYSFFDMPADKIPFVTDTDAGKAIDVEQLKRL